LPKDICHTIYTLRERPYFFEIFAAANLVIIQALLWPIATPMTTLPRVLLMTVAAMLLQIGAGVAIRAVVAWRRGRLPAYLAVIRSGVWLTDTLRIMIFSAMSLQAYGWIKLAIPLLNSRLFDQELWDIDAMLLAGHSPTELAVTLFSANVVLRTIDWSYANGFAATLLIASAFFGSSANRRLRIAFMDSNISLWLVGAWLYVALPSLGPAYRFPEVWLPLAALLDRTQTLQRLLMTNYQSMLQLAEGLPRTVNVMYAVAAFPSLHVAFQTLVFLWMRRVWRWGGIVFGAVAVTILIGSVVTGWHYLVDGIAGVLIAWLCYALSSRAHRMPRLFAIRIAARTF
jgi:hypothetical protein